MGGGQINGDAAGGEIKLTVDYRGAYPLAGFLDRRVRQPDHGKNGHPFNNVYLDDYFNRVQTDDGAAFYHFQHKFNFPPEAAVVFPSTNGNYISGLVGKQ